MRLKLAFVITSLARKGPGIVMLDIINELYLTNDITVLYFDELIDVPTLDFPKSVDTKKINFFGVENLQEYDIVHSHLLRPDVYCAFNRRKINNLISTVHSDFIYDLKISHGNFIGALVGYIWYFALKLFDKTIFLTDINRRRYPFIKRNDVIFNGRPLVEKKSQKEKNRKNEKFVIGACAYITKRKCFEQVLYALREIPDVDFHLVGDGPELDNLKILAKELGVVEQCKFFGFSEDVYGYMLDFDAFVMSSESEGMPLSLIESASISCPIISTDLDVIKEMFPNGEVVFYEFGKIDSLISSVSLVRDKHDLYSNRVYRRYAECLTEKKMAEKYSELYFQILENERYKNV